MLPHVLGRSISAGLGLVRAGRPGPNRGIDGGQGHAGGRPSCRRDALRPRSTWATATPVGVDQSPRMWSGGDEPTGHTQLYPDTSMGIYGCMFNGIQPILDLLIGIRHTDYE